MPTIDSWTLECRARRPVKIWTGASVTFPTRAARFTDSAVPRRSPRLGPSADPSYLKGLVTGRNPDSATPLLAPRSQPTPPRPALCRPVVCCNESWTLARPVHRQLASTELRVPPVVASGALSPALADRPDVNPGPAWCKYPLLATPRPGPDSLLPSLARICSGAACGTACGSLRHGRTRAPARRAARTDSAVGWQPRPLL